MSTHPTPERYDFVVVGAGSAGCAVAARLSEDPETTVLLLEAGGTDQRQEVQIPVAFSQLFKSDADWNYQTTPQRQLDSRSIYWPRGKVLGGSSSMNAMMWVVGFAADYDHWAELAGPEWSWEALAPLFADNGITVSAQRDPRSHTAAFLRAFEEAGYPVEEANKPEPGGFTQTLVTQSGGARWNSVRGYLDAAAGRENLSVLSEAHVDRVLFDGQRATGVRYHTDGLWREVVADAEVILAAGAVNTPTILLRSGIGPADDLDKLGIPVLVDSQDVGRQMRDHLVTFLTREAFEDTLFDAMTPEQLEKYGTEQMGMLTSHVAESYGFVKTDPGLEHADIEILAAPAAYVKEGLEGIPGHGLTIGSILLLPESRGSVTLADADPFSAPLIDPGYLTDPGGADRARQLEGVRICERILATDAMSGHIGAHYIAPENGETLEPEQRAEVAISTLSHTLYHPTSTARMGSDEGSVVDPELRVRGVHGLRVADASIMPEIIRGHTHAPSVVIGEKAAQFIRRSVVENARKGASRVS